MQIGVGLELAEKLAGRILDISDSKPIQDECGEYGRSLSPLEKQGSAEISQRFQKGRMQTPEHKIAENAADELHCSEMPSVLLMTGSERPSPHALLKKRGVPSRTEGERLPNYRVLGFAAALSRGIPGKALRAFWRLSGISSGKSRPYWGYGLILTGFR